MKYAAEDAGRIARRHALGLLQRWWRLALVAPGTVIGLATYGVAGDVNWLTGAALAVGGVPAVSYGVD